MMGVGISGHARKELGLGNKSILQDILFTPDSKPNLLSAKHLKTAAEFLPHGSSSLLPS